MSASTSTKRDRRRGLAPALVSPAVLLGLLGFVASGCVSQEDVRKPLQEHVAVTSRVLGFALDAQTEALETKLQLVEADPRLEAKLGTPAEIRKRLAQVKAEQQAIVTELKALKDRYSLEEGKP